MWFIVHWTIINLQFFDRRLTRWVLKEQIFPTTVRLWDTPAWPLCKSFVIFILLTIFNFFFFLRFVCSASFIVFLFCFIFVFCCCCGCYCLNPYGHQFKRLHGHQFKRLHVHHWFRDMMDLALKSVPTCLNPMAQGKPSKVRRSQLFDLNPTALSFFQKFTL